MCRLLKRRFWTLLKTKFKIKSTIKLIETMNIICIGYKDTCMIHFHRHWYCKVLLTFINRTFHKMRNKYFVWVENEVCHKKNPTLKQYHNKIAILQFSNHCVVFFFFWKVLNTFLKIQKTPVYFINGKDNLC